MTECTVLICTDIEGISGFVDWEQEEYETERVRQAMTADVTAAIEGIQSVTDAEIVVNDSHGSKLTLVPEDLPRPARLVRGGPRPMGMVAGISDEIDVAFFVGMHTRPGFGGGLEHTFSSARIAQVRVNDQPVGEVELNALAVDAFDAPVTLVTGDDRLERELEGFLPDAEYVVTKYAQSMKAAECRHPAVVREEIADAAATAVKQRTDRNRLNFDVSGTLTASVTYQQAEHADVAALWPEIEKTDSKTVTYEDEDVRALYQFVRAASKV